MTGSNKKAPANRGLWGRNKLSGSEEFARIERNTVAPDLVMDMRTG
jgi:hypothetical protein